MPPHQARGSMKLPAFQFYPGDWSKDPALRACSHGAKGVLIDTLCLMFECVPRGVLVTGASAWSEKDWAAAVGGNGDVTAGCIQELVGKGVVRRRGDESEAFQCRYTALLSDIPPGSYYSLRMVRDEHERQMTRQRVRKHRGNAPCNGEGNGEVTPLKQRSSTSTSSSVHPHPPRARARDPVPLPETLERVQDEAQRRAIPPAVAEKFWHDGERDGWLSPKTREPMHDWRHALQSYWLVWQDREQRRNPGPQRPDHRAEKAAREFPEPNLTVRLL